MNTDLTDHDELLADVIRLGDELRQAEQDMALLLRLKTAEADAKRLALDLRAAQERLAAAQAEEVSAQRRAALKGFEDITVTESGEHVLQCSYTITVTRLGWDGYVNTVRQNVYNGFEALPADAFNYLLEVHPDRIPAKIMVLCPEDAWEAFNCYLTGKRRGYVVSSAA